MNNNENMMIDEEEFDENENYITLTDDEGKEIDFEVIDDFEFEGKSYAVLLPFEETEDEVVILEIIDSE